MAKLRGPVLGLLPARTPAPALPALRAKSRALHDRGKADEAQRLGRAGPAYWGDAAFDFAFGVAAANVGKAGEGVPALERLLPNPPGDEAAHGELVRGQSMLGEDAQSCNWREAG